MLPLGKSSLQLSSARIYWKLGNMIFVNWNEQNEKSKTSGSSWSRSVIQMSCAGASPKFSNAMWYSIRLPSQASLPSLPKPTFSFGSRGRRSCCEVGPLSHEKQFQREKDLIGQAFLPEPGT